MICKFYHWKSEFEHAKQYQTFFHQQDAWHPKLEGSLGFDFPWDWNRKPISHYHSYPFGWNWCVQIIYLGKTNWHWRGQPSNRFEIDSMSDGTAELQNAKSLRVSTALIQRIVDQSKKCTNEKVKGTCRILKETQNTGLVITLSILKQTQTNLSQSGCFASSLPSFLAVLRIVAPVPSGHPKHASGPASRNFVLQDFVGRPCRFLKNESIIFTNLNVQERHEGIWSSTGKHALYGESLKRMASNTKPINWPYQVVQDFCLSAGFLPKFTNFCKTQGLLKINPCHQLILKLQSLSGQYRLHLILKPL